MKTTIKFIVFCISLALARADKNGECEGIFECLKSFFNGNIAKGPTNEDVIKVFELSPNIQHDFKIITEEELEKASQDLIKQTNSLLDTITNVLKFETDNITTSNISFNFTTVTNWTYTESDYSSYFNTSDDFFEINKEFIPVLPPVINTDAVTVSSKNEQTSLLTTQIKNKTEVNFEDYEDPSPGNSSDYAIIDYISLYEDTTNELITLPPTTESIQETTIKPIQDDDDWYIENEIFNEIINRTKNYIHDNFTSESSVAKNDDDLNDVLNGILEKYDDSFSDYPEIEEVFPTIVPEIPVTTTDSIIETTEQDDNPGFAFLVPPIEAVHLCKSRRMLSAERTIGLGFDVENYWDGVFYSHTFQGLKRADLVIEFTVMVEVTSKGENTVVNKINDTTFKIKGVDPAQSIDFKVQALPGEAFPFLKKIFLNDREICKERRNWKPSLLGPQEQAVISPLESPNSSGVYYCGRSKVSFTPLVVKGVTTKEGEFPWHVALFVKNPESKNWDYACGGTVISRKTIITAAHCVVSKEGSNLEPKSLLVIAGKHKLYEVDATQTVLKIQEIRVHPNYTNTRSKISDDLALLITEDHIDYGQYVQPICQWNDQQDDKEIIFQEYGTVVGWGVTENGTSAEVLQSASLKVVPDVLCLESRPAFFSRYLTSSTFCAGNRNGTSACNGDSGGALLFPIKEKDDQVSWYLRGVVSLGVRREGGACDPNQFVVFTDVVKYRQWIDENQQL